MSNAKPYTLITVEWDFEKGIDVVRRRRFALMREAEHACKMMYSRLTPNSELLQNPRYIKRLTKNVWFDGNDYGIILMDAGVRIDWDAEDAFVAQLAVSA